MFGVIVRQRHRVDALPATEVLYSLNNETNGRFWIVGKESRCYFEESESETLPKTKDVRCCCLM